MKASYVGVLIALAVMGTRAFGAAAAEVAADAEIEKEIRKLEEQEVQAVLAHDAATLARLWDKHYVVHNPEGRIVPAGPSITDRPVLQTARAAFVREIESIVINGDAAFSMGSETVTSSPGAAKAGEVTRRRYTNVWMLKEGVWKLVARHANKVSGQN